MGRRLWIAILLPAFWLAFICAEPVPAWTAGPDIRTFQEIAANYEGPELLSGRCLSIECLLTSWPGAAFLVAPPLIFLLLSGLERRMRWRNSPEFRSRSALARFRRSAEELAQCRKAGPEECRRLLRAFNSFLSDKFSARTDGFTLADFDGLLRNRGIDASARAEFGRIRVVCERECFGDGVEPPLKWPELVAEAMDVATRIDGQVFCSAGKKHKTWLPFAALSAVVLICAVRTVYGLDADRINELQRKGRNSFERAVEMAYADSARASDLFQKAALYFETIVRAGGIENGRLYFNIGNCYLRMGAPGPAIFNYLLAERMIPGDPALARNLKFARSRVSGVGMPDQAGRTNGMEFLKGKALSAGTIWIFSGCWYLFWTFRSAYLFCRRTWLKYAVYSAAGATVLFFSLVVFQAYSGSAGKSGIIVAEAVTGRTGDSFAFDPAFERPLHSGVEFTLLEKRPGWLHIMIYSRAACWVPASSARIF